MDPPREVCGAIGWRPGQAAGPAGLRRRSLEHFDSCGHGVDGYREETQRRPGVGEVELFTAATENPALYVVAGKSTCAAARVRTDFPYFFCRQKHRGDPVPDLLATVVRW